MIFRKKTREQSFLKYPIVHLPPPKRADERARNTSGDPYSCTQEQRYSQEQEPMAVSQLSFLSVLYCCSRTVHGGAVYVLCVFIMNE